MEYVIQPCGERESAYIEERFWAQSGLAIHEDTEAEQRVFKVTDGAGILLGGCVLEVDLCKIAEFNRLWVAEEHRRRGIATALILAAEEAARARGCPVIVNNFCFDFNQAGPLFEGLGYRRCGVTVGWPRGHEAYYYQKRLNTAPANTSPGPAGTAYAVQPGSQEEGERIGRALEAFNTAAVPRTHPYLSLDRKLVDETGAIVGGCIWGVSGWDTAHIDLLWTEPFAQCQRSSLLVAIETEARAHGACLVLTDAAGAQAEFFRAQGYRVTATHDYAERTDTLAKRLE